MIAGAEVKYTRFCTFSEDQEVTKPYSLHLILGLSNNNLCWNIYLK